MPITTSNLSAVPIRYAEPARIAQRTLDLGQRHGRVRRHQVLDRLGDPAGVASSVGKQ